MSYAKQLYLNRPWGMIAEETGPVAIKRGFGGDDYTIFLDFEESFALDAAQPAQAMATLFDERKKLDAGAQSDSMSFIGWVGFFGYDFLAAQVGMRPQARRDIAVPDGYFGRPQTIIHFKGGHTEIETMLAGRTKQLEEAASKPLIFREHPRPNVPITCNLEFDAYKQRFEKAHEAVLNGNTYQIKISQRYRYAASVDALSVFLKLTESNPAPEAFMFTFPGSDGGPVDTALISCSPESVINLNGALLQTKPIGGTWERKEGTEEAQLLHAFNHNAKELAEHNMIVDLERNDLARVCRTNTVRIVRYREIERYAYLYHLVTLIEGRLRDDATRTDIIRALLPGGSVTGCPKISTLGLIDEIEPCFRGPYTGSFGTLADNGDMQLNLIIRTLLSTPEATYVQSGGGIVAGSTAEYEYRENTLKAKALLNMLG